jgi:hypothetical protein
MKVALAGNDQPALNSAVQNLKMCLRYIGILTIIIMALYAYRHRVWNCWPGSSFFVKWIPLR